MPGPDLAVPGGAASPAERQTTVLFAEVQAAAPQAPAATAVPGGDAAARYLEVLGQAAELSGGRVVHTRDNGVLVLFSTPSAAAAAAARMHTYAETLPPKLEKLGVRIGFHAGPVGQRNQDIFGDTVNLALQVADAAKDGQILTSHGTASSLSPAMQNAVRPARRIRVKGKDGEVLLGELIWRNSINQIVSEHTKAASVRAVLRVTCGGKVLTRRRQEDSVSIGRDPECDLVIDGAKVSRRHCLILLRGATAILRDDSSNGTFATVQGQAEVQVRGGELPLGKAGGIALGQPSDSAEVTVKYLCE